MPAAGQRQISPARRLGGQVAAGLGDGRRLARDHAQRLMAEGKTVKIFTVGKKGQDVLRRQFREQIVETMDIRGNKPVDYEFAAEIASLVGRDDLEVGHTELVGGAEDFLGQD